VFHNFDAMINACVLVGPQQCDEDDYGYVSQEASAFYSKMMDKYGSVPSEENKFAKKSKSSSSDLLSTKVCVSCIIYVVARNL